MGSLLARPAKRPDVGRWWRWFLDHQPEINLALAVFWIIAVIPTALWWKESILWVAIMSLWANVASHFAAWLAAKAERKVNESNE